MGNPSDDELDSKISRKLAARLADSPDTMAWVLARYKEIERVEDAAIQRLLGINENAYFHLAICGRPRSDLFSLDIEIIAEHIGLEQEPLIRLVRRVETVSTFQDYADAEARGIVAAARDMAEEPESYGSESNEAEEPPKRSDDEQ